MTYEEAIVIIRHLWCSEHIDYPDEEVREALDIAKKAIEKQIPKKPEIDEFEGTDYWQGRYSHWQYSCPYCGMRLDTHFDCCCNCGQAIDWSEENDK